MIPPTPDCCHCERSEAISGFGRDVEIASSPQEPDLHAHTSHAAALNLTGDPQSVPPADPARWQGLSPAMAQASTTPAPGFAGVTLLTRASSGGQGTKKRLSSQYNHELCG
jgi:hypothetical protein